MLALLALVASVLIWAAPTQAQGSNQPPVAIALTPSLSADGNTMTLDGTLSFDPDDGDTAGACVGCTYKWEVVTSTWKFLEGFGTGLAPTAAVGAGAGVVDATIDVTNVDLAGLVPSNGALIEFRLTVTDSKGVSDSDTTTYNIMTNDTPTADISLTAMLADPDAAADATTAEKYTIDAVIDGPGENGNADNEWDIMEGALLVLDGSGSSDPDGDDLNYLWSLLYESGSVTDVGFPAQDAAAASGSTLAIDSAASTEAKLSTETNGGSGDTQVTVGRLNVSRAATATSQSPYNAIFTLAVTDAGAAVDASATGNVDSTALIRIVIHDQPADPKITAVLIGGDADPRDPQIDDGDPGTTTAADRIDRAFPPGDKYFVHEGDDALDITLTAVTFDADNDTNANGMHGATDGETAPTVTWSEDDGTAGQQLRIPADAEAGDTFTITATIPRTDVSRTLTFEVIEPQQTPVATILTSTISVDHDSDSATPNITLLAPTVKPKDGTYTLNGFGFDPDGGSTTSIWAQVDANGAVDPSADNYVPLTGAFSNEVSFDIPAAETKINSITLAFNAVDDESTFDTKVVTVNFDRTPDPVPPSASAGSGQVVAPESTVILSGSSAGFDEDTTQTYAWTVKSVSTSPGPETLNSRASVKVHEDLNSFIEAANGANYTNTGDVDSTTTDTAINAEDILTSIPASAGTPDNDVAEGQFQWFEAPKLSAGLKYAQITFTVTATGTIDGTAGSTRTGDVTITVADTFFSSYIDGPNYCYNRSLGGPTTEPHDSTGDGVANVCSLKTTRRAAVASQNALEQLVALGSTLSRQVAGANTPDDNTDDVSIDVDLEDLVLGYTWDAGTPNDDTDDVEFDGTCAMAKKLAPDTEDADACDDDATELTPLPDPVDPADAAMFYSGVITGPDFCTNRSLGGAQTFAHDSDDPKDGVADVCSLHTTRREAIARQLALEMFRTDPHPQYNNALAAACAALGSETYGADADALAKDGCSIPPGTPEAQPGNELP